MRMRKIHGRMGHSHPRHRIPIMPGRLVWTVPWATLFLAGPLTGCGLAAAHRDPRIPMTGLSRSYGVGKSTKVPSKAVPAPPHKPEPVTVPFVCDVGPAMLARAGASVELGEKTTVYPHSWPNRNTNLLTASRYLCGRVLAPGETLSFNAAIGETTLERGYQYGPTFVGNRVVPGLGGGVCQVASTLYDAARFAAIRVLERHQHGMRVPYVPPGEDATVSSPHFDLVIQNSSGGPLVLAAGAEGPKVRIALFGARRIGHGHFEHEILDETPFPTIRIADPQIPSGETREIQEGVEGTRAHTWYVVTDRDGHTRRVDLGIDDYRPSPHILRIGTGPRGGTASHGKPESLS